MPNTGRIWPTFLSSRRGLSLNIPSVIAKRLGRIQPKDFKSWWVGSVSQPINELAAGLRDLVANLPSAAPPDESDPQKHRWGGRSKNERAEMSATVHPTSREDWFQIDLRVETLSEITGKVRFTSIPASSRRRSRLPSQTASPA